ncbi:hypothetical protein [Ammoniphilus sp. CFH 90114]|uniref:hypothetical protein n=1 Tax=Ammoniphilus sp. CFH 90114 TaxID=2493665 RepID=UPI00100F851D|nr:hypothetical protein [Ammoniphilus sp. CFH 90114]RXT06384.1 hypothetical protein EIZ39_15040 [Ammoniphilus sp. CFH 90114]
MEKQALRVASRAGIVAGLVLGLFLKGMEVLTQTKVYTLLLNLDYIPFLNQLNLPEIIEFLFHMIVSVILSIILMFIIRLRSWSKQKTFNLIVTISIFIGILLYPTTVLSERTPGLFDLSAIAFWIVGHGIYGIVLGFYLCNRFKDDLERDIELQ